MSSHASTQNTTGSAVAGSLALWHTAHDIGRPECLTTHVYRIQYKRPGCLARLGALIIGGPLVMVATAMVLELFGFNDTHPLFATFAPFIGYAVGFVAFLRLWQRVMAEEIPICPHCGAASEPVFRVCRRCGRVK